MGATTRPIKRSTIAARPNLKAWPAVYGMREQLRLAIDHVDTAPGDGNNKAFVPQHTEGLLGGAFGYSVLLGDALDRRHRLARSDLPRGDHLAQDAGKLQVGRLPGEMINGHTASVGIPWRTWDPRVP